MTLEANKLAEELADILDSYILDNDLATGKNSPVFEDELSRTDP